MVPQTTDHLILALGSPSQASMEVEMKGQAVQKGLKVERGVPAMETSSHYVESSGLNHNPWKCEEHPSYDVELYCKQCDKVICVRCMMSHHRRHDYAPADDIVDEYKRKVAELTGQTKGVQQRLTQAVDNLRRTKTSLDAAEKSTTEEVHQYYNQIIAELEKRRDALLQKAKSLTDKKKGRLDAQLAELSRIGETLQTSIKFSEDVTETCIPVEFLFLWKQISDRLEELCTTYESHPCEPQENCTIKFHREEDLEKKIRDSGSVVSNPDPEEFTVDGIEDQHFTEKKRAVLTVTCRDIAGNVLTEHQHEVNAEIQAENGGGVTQCQVVNNQNGTYGITINPQTHGIYKMTVSVVNGDKAFPIGPLRIVVSPAHRSITAPTHIFGKEAASDKKMRNPWGIAVWERGKIVVSDVETNSLLVFNKEGVFLQTVGKEGRGKLEFKSPRGLACTPDNHIIVAEKNNHRLQEVTLEGSGKFVHVRFFGTGKPGDENGQLHGPSCVAVNSEGIVFATDSQNNRIQFFKQDGAFLGIIGKSEHEPLDEPYGISIYKQPQVLGGGDRELIFVTERKGNQVRCFEKKGDTYIAVKTFGKSGVGKGQLQEPVGILADPRSGYVFVTEYQNQRVSIFSRSGEYLYSFGERGSGTSVAQFYNPMSIAALEAAHIIVTDCGNGRLQTFCII